MVKIFYWSAAVSIGGFLFGFDTAVISGADQPLQQLWKSSDIFHGALIMSSALWGTVVGALSGNIPTEQLLGSIMRILPKLIYQKNFSKLINNYCLIKIN